MANTHTADMHTADTHAADISAAALAQSDETFAERLEAREAELESLFRMLYGDAPEFDEFEDAMADLNA